MQILPKTNAVKRFTSLSLRLMYILSAHTLIHDMTWICVHSKDAQKQAQTSLLGELWPICSHTLGNFPRNYRLKLKNVSSNYVSEWQKMHGSFLQRNPIWLKPGSQGSLSSSLKKVLERTPWERGWSDWGHIIKMAVISLDWRLDAFVVWKFSDGNWNSYRLCDRKGITFRAQ